MNNNYKDPSMKDFFGWIFKGWGFVLLFIVISGVTVIGLWAFGVATADIFGSGEAHKIKESAPNRIVQQASFEQAYADIKKFDQQVKDAAKAIEDWDKANVGWQQRDNAIGTLANQRRYLTDTLAGLKQQCQTTAANYNADSRKYLAKDFKAVDLPYEIDLAEHCK